ncbi:cAMP-binding domain of CRP or a regulatory subunit of cAMP-dependent protein kinases [Chitinophaga jiangningensis]|uniref:cAMP-binding domain of CRP or a regulatory subunit of cAMP-dependent protein kinases n=1 Tax=Chitinophaga jiangningensis TaxID=1419482 RepID=A0A1M6YBL6_9BACT|nr:Crp/Fnr family transcriptional regulator [Chitinophaga jiangningensis]SHL15638.1 cAMP-binding domain of CRP or a regulatory subunit of cAMP-dependent protein kinases [Chitinophaga jiangningensis]
MSFSINILQGLLQELSGVLPADTAPLFIITRVLKLEEGEVYIREGDLSRKLAFIEKGIMRAYKEKPSGDEATLFLRWEGQLIASHDAIIQQQPSRFIYRAMEPVTLLEIDYDKMEQVLKDHPEFEPLRNYFLMKMLAEALDGLEGFVFLSPEERYLRLVDSKWGVVNRVPDKYIASMLGVTPVSLSRIRKRLHARGRKSEDGN